MDPAQVVTLDLTDGGRLTGDMLYLPSGAALSLDSTSNVMLSGSVATPGLIRINDVPDRVGTADPGTLAAEAGVAIHGEVVDDGTFNIRPAFHAEASAALGIMQLYGSLRGSG